MNHQDIVARVKAENPQLFASVEGMLLFVLTVLEQLPPTEHAGLVKAPAGGEPTPETKVVKQAELFQEQ